MTDNDITPIPAEEAVAAASDDAPAITEAGAQIVAEEASASAAQSMAEVAAEASAAAPIEEATSVVEAVEAVPAEAAAAPIEEATPVVEAVEAVSAEAAAAPVEALPPVAEVAPAPALAPSAQSIDDIKPGMALNGRVKRIELYGAFVDLGIGTDGLLHISQLGQRDVRNVEDVVHVGQDLEVFVLKIDKEQRRIALSLVKPQASKQVDIPWEAIKTGMDVTGTVIKIENYGVFLEFGAERPGMIHVSELANDYVKSPTDVVQLGSELTARVIKFDRRKKRIDLSVKALQAQENRRAMAELEEPSEALPTAMELALRQAMGQNGGANKKSRDAEKRERREMRDREMEDIISRTLKHHHK
jgi:predicted RNA-binding protein with RPS1 domain